MPKYVLTICKTTTTTTAAAKKKLIKNTCMRELKYYFTVLVTRFI